jgi:hypothetical protein
MRSPMTTLRAAIISLAFLSTMSGARGLLAEEVDPPAPSIDELRRVTFGVDVFPYLGTSAIDGPDTIRTISVGVLGSLSGGVEGAAAASIFDIQMRRVKGAQAAGVFAYNSGWLTGAQGAGVAAMTFGEVIGVQGAGVASVALGGLTGVQGAGVLNLATGPVIGVQASGVANVTTGAMTGAQFGVVNVATEGIHGAQFGVINYALDSDASFGLINIIPRGRTHVSAWGDETGTVHVSLKHGTKYLHNIYDIAYRVTGEDYALQWGFGLGGHVPLAERVFVDLDLLASHVTTSDFDMDQVNLVGRFNATVGVQIVPKLTLFFGPSVAVFVSEEHDGASLPLFGDHLIMERQTVKDREVNARVWPGFVVGLQGL